MSIKESAGKVADYLRIHGWIQGKSVGPFGQACLAHAMSAVVTNEVYWELRDALEAKVKVITNWNDKKGRTFEEVIQLLESVE